MKVFSHIFKITKSNNRTKVESSPEKLVFLLFFFFQIIVFYPALRNPKPWSDDWTYIYFANDSSRNIVHDAIAAGRPILGFLVQLAHQSDLFIRNPLLLQISSLIGLYILQLSLFSKLKEKGLSKSMLILTPLLMILIPGIQGYVYFLSCFPYTWACLFGFLSFDLISSRAPTRKVTGYSLFIVAFLIYPTGAMFYFLSYFIDFIIRYDQEKEFCGNIRNLIQISVRLLVPGTVGMIIVRLVRTATNIEEASRIELINNIESSFDKTAWVLTRLFVSEFRLFTVASPTPSRAAIETSLVFALLMFFILKPLDNLTFNRLLNFVLVIFLPLFGALPNLVILENQFEFRTLTSTHVMSLILWTYCLQRMSDRVSGIDHARKALYRQNSGRLKIFVCILLLMTILFNTQRDSRKLWVEPSSIRDAITWSALQKLDVNGTEPICMVIPSSVYTPLNKLGVYSMKSDLASSWVTEPYMRLKLEQSNLDLGREIFVAREVTECKSPSIVINYSALGSSN